MAAELILARLSSLIFLPFIGGTKVALRVNQANFSFSLFVSLGASMAENSNIEWTDHTWNPWIGCTKISPGCDNCYAATQDKFRKWTPDGWGGERRRTSAGNWRKPLQWQAQAAEFMAQHGRRQRVFCASLADVFDNEVPDAWRRDLFALILATPDLDWLLLTKRIGNAHRMLPPEWVAAPPAREIHRMPDNVWIGATVVNQEEADRDIPKLLDVPARVRFLSMEPLLGPVDLTRVSPHLFAAKANALTGVWKWDDGPKKTESPPLDWVIVGGESGPGARPMHPDWARSLRDQCASAGVPFLFKQWGEWQIASLANGHYDSDMERNAAHWVDMAGAAHKPSSLGLNNPHAMVKVGKKAAGRLLDGVEHNGFPGAV